MLKIRFYLFAELKIIMNLISNSLLFLLFFLFSIENNAYSLSNYQIKQICQNKPSKSSCIKNLKFKKLNLLKGNKIEIPVIPYKK